MQINFTRQEIARIVEHIDVELNDGDFIPYEEIEDMLDRPIRPATTTKNTTQWRGYVSARQDLLRAIEAYINRNVPGDRYFRLQPGVANDEFLDEFGCTKLMGDSIATWRLGHHKTKIYRAPLNAHTDFMALLGYDENLSPDMRRTISNLSSALAMVSELQQQVIEYVEKHKTLSAPAKRRLAMQAAEHDDPQTHFEFMLDKMREKNE